MSTLRSNFLKTVSRAHVQKRLTTGWKQYFHRTIKTNALKTAEVIGIRQTLQALREENKKRLQNL